MYVFVLVSSERVVQKKLLQNVLQKYCKLYTAISKILNIHREPM